MSEHQIYLWQNAILWFTLGGLVGAPVGWFLGWLVYGVKIGQVVRWAFKVVGIEHDINVLVQMVAVDIDRAKARAA